MLKFVNVILAVAVLTGLALADIEQDIQALETKFETSLTKCKTSTSINEVELGKVMETGEFSTKAGCFIACFTKEFGVMNADNKFDKEKIYKVLEPVTNFYKQNNKPGYYKEATTVIDGCLETQAGGSDSCEAGKKAGECLLSGAKKIGMF